MINQIDDAWWASHGVGPSSAKLQDLGDDLSQYDDKPHVDLTPTQSAKLLGIEWREYVYKVPAFAIKDVLKHTWVFEVHCWIVDHNIPCEIYWSFTHEPDRPAMGGYIGHCRLVFASVHDAVMFKMRWC